MPSKEGFSHIREAKPMLRSPGQKKEPHAAQSGSCGSGSCACSSGGSCSACGSSSCACGSGGESGYGGCSGNSTEDQQ